MLQESGSILELGELVWRESSVGREERVEELWWGVRIEWSTPVEESALIVTKRRVETDLADNEVYCTTVRYEKNLVLSTQWLADSFLCLVNDLDKLVA